MLHAIEKKLLVGSQLSDVLAPAVTVGLPTNVLLTPASPEFPVSRALRFHSAGGIGSGTWTPGANLPVACEFTIQEPITVYQLGWYNGGGTMTDSCDVGIYDTSWNRKISTGGTARSGVSAVQFVDVADTVLAPGRYRLAMSNNGITAANSGGIAASGNAAVWGMEGLFDSATAAYPLPDPLTNMAAAATAAGIPLMVIAARALA